MLKEFLEGMHHFLAWVEDWSPWEAHNLIPETCEGTLYGKKDFADMFKARVLRWGDYPGFSRWALNVSAPGTIWEGDLTPQVMWCEAEGGVMHRVGGGKDPQAKEHRWALEASKRTRKWTLPSSLQEPVLLTPWLPPHETDLGRLTSMKRTNACCPNKQGMCKEHVSVRCTCVHAVMSKTARIMAQTRLLSSCESLPGQDNRQ